MRGPPRKLRKIQSIANHGGTRHASPLDMSLHIDSVAEALSVCGKRSGIPCQNHGTRGNAQFSRGQYQAL